MVILQPRISAFGLFEFGREQMHYEISIFLNGYLITSSIQVQSWGIKDSVTGTGLEHTLYLAL